jgi:hypothetical protein
MGKFFRSGDGFGISVAPRSDPIDDHGAGLERRELARRVNDGLDVTLSWHPALDELTVRVRDERDDAYFEIHPEHHLALEVYYHPYAYLALSDLRCENDRLVA